MDGNFTATHNVSYRRNNMARKRTRIGITFIELYSSLGVGPSRPDAAAAPVCNCGH
jgi:hypothetical protein